MSDTINILLACGNGASSGYLAMRTRKAAKKKGLSTSVQAVPISNIGSMISNYDVVLIGPHHAYDMEFVQSLCEQHNIKSALIPKDVYANLDGEALVEIALAILNEK